MNSSFPNRCSFKHEQGVGFLEHKDIVKSVIGCRPNSSRFMTVRLRAIIFNITIIQVYAPTSSYDESEVDEFYRELRSPFDQTPKQNILVVQGDWNAKVGEDAQEDLREIFSPFCNTETNDRGLKLLDFATYNLTVEACLRKYNSKKAYQLVKDLTTEKQGNIAYPFTLNLQPYKTSRGSVSQRRMKSLTGGLSTAQTFTAMRLRGIQQYLTAHRY